MKSSISSLVARIAVATVVLAGTPAVVLVTAGPAAAEDNGLALTPPMGFNDWNAYKCDVSAALIEQTADTMVATGMRAAGYRYVNIDDCWLTSARAADGSLVADPAKFPAGIKAVADYVHARGLKLGIYEDAGTSTCAGYPGSLGHEKQDAATFAGWDVDYLKYDQCNIPFADFPGRTHEQVDTMLYTTMSRALRATGRPIVFSMCNGTDSAALPWRWGAPVSNLWRTTTDIQDSFGSMAAIVAQNAALARYAHRGAWNDPDMLEIGNGGMTDSEYRSEFSLWSIMAAPLLAGTTLTTATPQTLAIYTNRDVIAVDQDRLGRQARLLTSAGGHEVFAKPLANGDVAVALFNASNVGARIATDARRVGLSRRVVYTEKDLWSKAVTETAGRISAYVPAHATVLYRVAAPAHPVSVLRQAPSTTLSLTSSHDLVRTGTRATVRVTLADDGLTPVVRPRLGLAVPSGWTVRLLHRDRSPIVHTGHASTAEFAVRAPASAPPISTADLTATAAYGSVRGATTARSVLTLPLVSPLPRSLRRADTTGAGALVGAAGTNLAVQAAGTGVSPVTTTPRGTTPASDQYGAIYRPGAAGTTAAVQVTVTAQQATPGFGARNAKAGLLIRNHATAPAGSPEGVVLYVTGSGTVGMSWNAGGGATVDTSSALSAAVAYPVTLRLVRSGPTYTGSYSTDGTTWTPVATATVAPAAAAAHQDAGVFHTSASTTSTTEADFSGLAVR